MLPFIVLRELDAKKTHSGIVGQNARRTNRLLESLRIKGSLRSGVWHEGSFYQVIDTQSIVADSNDDKILQMIKILIASRGHSDDIKLITNDISFRLLADAQGITSEPLDDTMCESIDGWLQTDTIDDAVVNQLHTQGSIIVTDVFDNYIPVANTCFVLKGASSNVSVLARYKKSDNKLHVVDEIKDVWGIKPKNKEQRFAFDVLFDDNIKLVVLIGCAGTGKTLLGTAAGIKSTVAQRDNGAKSYKKFIMTRPIVPLGNDLGYLPGTFEEKMSPWIAPIHDNLDVLFKSAAAKQMLAKFLEDGTIEVEAVTYIRGRSIQDSFFIVDEAQNLTIDELKTIVTRAGHGTKIVLTGDIEQIDNKHMNVHSNGLLTLVDKFLDEDICAVVKLEKTERSRLAELSAKLL